MSETTKKTEKCFHLTYQSKSGIEKMCKACREYEAPEPVYIAHPYDLMVRFDAAPAVLPFIEEERRKYELSRMPREGEVTDKVASKATEKAVEVLKLMENWIIV